jgi:hypothetical protein
VGARRSHERIGVVVEPGELRAVQPGVVHELELPLAGWSLEPGGRCKGGAARRGFGNVGRARVSVWARSDEAFHASVMRYVAEVLRRLGYRPHVRVVPRGAYNEALQTGRVPLKPVTWYGGDLGASDFLRTWFACDGGETGGRFCDPRLERLMGRAAELEATDARGAAIVWADVDRRVADAAAAVPLVTPVEFVSARVRNYQKIIHRRPDRRPSLVAVKALFRLPAPPGRRPACTSAVTRDTTWRRRARSHYGRTGRVPQAGVPTAVRRRGAPDSSPLREPARNDAPMTQEGAARDHP